MANSLSQFKSKCLTPSWTTIELEKFSYATSNHGAASHQWVHDARRDELFVVFQTIRILRNLDNYEERTVLKVLAGAEVLEQQDIGDLAAAAREFQTSLLQGHLDPRTESPVQVVVKNPCIALRCPASTNTVRRMQLRFKNDPDYLQAVSIFRAMKLPMKDSVITTVPSANLRSGAASVPPARRSLVFPSQTLVPSSRSTWEGQEALPTADDTSNGDNGTSRPFSAILKSSSTIESPFFRRLQNASSEQDRPRSAWSNDRESINRPLTTSPLSSISSVHRQAISSTAARVLTPSIFVSQMEKQQDQRRVTYNSSLFDNRAETPMESQLSASKMALLDTLSLVQHDKPIILGNGSAVTYHSQGSDYLADNSRLKRYTTTQNTTCDDKVERSSKRRISLPFTHDSDRPLSAPSGDGNYFHSPWIPPKRELPFPKPRETLKPCSPDTDLSLILPPTLPNPGTTGIKATKPEIKKTPVPPRKRPAKRVAPPAITEPMTLSRDSQNPGTLVTTSAKSGANKRRNLTTQHEEEPSPLAGKSTSIPRPATAPGLKSKAAISKKRQSGNVLDIGEVQKPSKSVADKATQTQTLSGRDHTVPGSTMAAVSGPVQSMAEDDLQDPPPQTYLDGINLFISKHKSTPPIQEVWVRPGYADASEEERQNIINRFICENLENEDFIKLCKDTETAWRRIGLGM